MIMIASLVALLSLQVAASNGHIAYTLTKEFAESFQDLFQRLLIKEIEELELRDVRVQQKTEQGRLNSLMSSVRLHELDLEHSAFSVDFIPKSGSKTA